MRTSAELGTKESMWSGLARETRPEEKPVMIPLAVFVVPGTQDLTDPVEAPEFHSQTHASVFSNGFTEM